MKPWPWERQPEKRSGGYTTQRISSLLDAASGRAVLKSVTTDCVEVAAGYFQSAFQSAEILASERVKRVLKPFVLGMIARDMVSTGESIWQLMVKDGRLRLARSSYNTVWGDSPHEEDWLYQLDVPSPSAVKNQTYFVKGPDVLHFRYSTSKLRPWRGLSALEWASSSGRLLAGLEAVLGNEAAAASGYILAVPSGSLGEDAAEEKISAVDELLIGVKGARGGTIGTELGAEPQDTNDMRTGKTGIAISRIGADFPQSLVDLREAVRSSLLSSLGIPPGFTSTATATNWRESYRAWIYGRVVPMSKLVESELSDKFHEAVELDFHNLQSSDIQGKSRSYKALVDAGMDSKYAAMLCGFDLGRNNAN